MWRSARHRIALRQRVARLIPVRQHRHRAALQAMAFHREPGAIEGSAGLERVLAGGTVKQHDGGGRRGLGGFAHQRRRQSDAVERPEQGAEHETGAPGVERRELHRLGIEAVARVARMRARQAQPFEQLGAMPVVAQEVERRPVGEARDLHDAVAIGHERAVVTRGEPRKIGLRLRIDRLEGPAPAHARLRPAPRVMVWCRPQRRSRRSEQARRTQVLPPAS